MLTKGVLETFHSSERVTLSIVILVKCDQVFYTFRLGHSGVSNSLVFFYLKVVGNLDFSL